LIATSSLIAIIAEPVSYNAIIELEPSLITVMGVPLLEYVMQLTLFSFNALKFYQIRIVLGLSFYLGYLILVVFAMSGLLALIIAKMALTISTDWITELVIEFGRFTSLLLVFLVLGDA
jgi:hypothetical protein